MPGHTPKEKAKKSRRGTGKLVSGIASKSKGGIRRLARKTNPFGSAIASRNKSAKGKAKGRPKFGR